MATDTRDLEEHEDHDETDSPTISQTGVVPGGPQMAWDVPMPTPDINETRAAAARVAG